MQSYVILPKKCCKVPEITTIIYIFAKRQEYINTMHKTFETTGTCSTFIDFDIDETETLHNVRFTNGCPGNTRGIELLCEGRNAREVSKKLKGILCRQKPTSCPDQFARAIEEALNGKN